MMKHVNVNLKSLRKALNLSNLTKEEQTNIHLRLGYTSTNKMLKQLAWFFRFSQPSIVINKLKELKQL